MVSPNVLPDPGRLKGVEGKEPAILFDGEGITKSNLTPGIVAVAKSTYKYLKILKFILR